MLLNQEELSRYARHLCLPEIGITGQEKLKQAKILCIGAGGLGSAAISYLTAAGIGFLGIMDSDCVELSNLQRQIIHGYPNIGQLKVISAQQWIKNNNPQVQVKIYPERLTAKNAQHIIADYDLIIDGTDNFASRYLINDACYFAKKPNIHASIYRFEGQISVFCAQNGPCYRCLFPVIPPADAIPNCSEAGVLGVLPGLLGLMQATEALKLIIGCGQPMINRLLTVNALEMQFNNLDLLKNPACLLCGENPSIKTVENICATPTKHAIDVPCLRRKMAMNPGLKLLDVREPFELQTLKPIEHAINIPLNTLSNHLDLIPRNESFIVYCKSGVRSYQAVRFLREHGFDCLNLLGGIEAWNAR